MTGAAVPELFSMPSVAHQFGYREGKVFRLLELSGYKYEELAPANKNGQDLAHGDWWKSLLKGEINNGSNSGTVTSVDLFSGSGGFANGLVQALRGVDLGLSSLAAVDLDLGALLVHKMNHGTRSIIDKSVEALLDHSVVGAGAGARWQFEPEVTHDTLGALRGKVDVLLAGPPCQGNSNLNNRTRYRDDRNRLYLTVPAMAAALDASTVVIENVPGVVHDKSQVTQSARALLEKAGYSVTEGVLRSDLIGWPQTRKRFFMVASKLEDPIPLGHIQRANQRETLDVRWAIGDLTESLGENLLDSVPEFSEENKKRMEFMVSAAVRNMPNEIRPASHKDGHTYPSVYGRMEWSEPSPTITTGYVTPGRGRFIHPDLPRTITAREAARIQGFSDDYFRREVLEKSKANRGSLAKWIGDAVPAALGELAFLSILPGLRNAK